jgi:hypothetical protein
MPTVAEGALVAQFLRDGRAMDYSNSVILPGRSGIVVSHLDRLVLTLPDATVKRSIADECAVLRARTSNVPGIGESLPDFSRGRYHAGMSSVQTWDPATYARHARFVSDLGSPVRELLAPQPSERILDLGCGGFRARVM